MALFVFDRSIHCQRLRRTHNGQWAGEIEKDSGTLISKALNTLNFKPALKVK